MGQSRGQSMDARPGALGMPRKLVGAGLIMGASMAALLFNSAMLAPDTQLTYEPSEAEAASGDARMRGTLTGSSSKAVRGLVEAEAHRCSQAELDLTVQREMQRQYCLRHYTNADVNLVPFLTSLDFRGPKTSQPGEPDVFHPIKLYGYKDGKDIVSNFLESRGDWERHYMEATVTALGLAGQRRFGLNPKASADREGLLFLDIGANVGSHSLFVSAAGYSVVAFEPMPANEWALRSTLCANADLSQRITFVPKGLGSSEQVCRVISHGANWGDGGLLCDPKEPIPNDYILRGQTQTTTLDHTALHCIQPHSGSRRRLGGVKMDVEGFEHHVVKGGMDHFWNTMQVPFINYENDCMTSMDDRRTVLNYFLGLGTYRFNCGDTKEGAEVFSTIGAAASADKETYKGPSPEEELIKVCHEIFMYHDDLVVKRKDGKSYVATMEDPLPLNAASAVQAPQ